MKFLNKRIFSSFLILIFIITNTALVYAKGSSGGRSSSSSARSSVSSSSKSSSSSSSRSVTGGSSSSSSGYSGSSSSKSSGSTGSSSSGSTNSSSGTSGSSSSKGSTSSGSTNSGSTGSTSSGSTNSSSGYSGSSSSKSSTGTGGTGSTSSSTTSKSSAKTESVKNQYMQDTYKKQVSSSNYADYKKKLTPEQTKTYESSMKNSYGTGSKMDFDQAMRTRSTRVSDYSTRPIRVNINSYNFGGPFSYGSAFVGPWDMWFLMRASDLFWYHHWHDISPYRNNFETAQFAEMENRIKQLEAQNLAKDSNYLEPGVDPDLMLSSDYQQQNMDKLYYTNKYTKPATNPIRVFIPILIISIGLIVIIHGLSRRKVQKPPRRNGGIY